MVIVDKLITKQRKKPTVSLLIQLFLFITTGFSQPYHNYDTVILKDLTAQFVNKVFTVSLKFDKLPLFHPYWITPGEKLFIDLIGGDIQSLVKEKYVVNVPGLQEIEVKYYPGYEPRDGKVGKVDGIILTMRKGQRYQIIPENENLKIIFPGIKQPVSGAKKEKARLPEEFSFTPAQKIGPQDKAKWEEAIMGWRKLLEIGVENYRPLQVAKEQYELAQLKLREAKRGYFPTAVVRLINTDGKTVEGVDIFSKTYELEFEQPITYGGELRYKVEQAKVNMELARLEYRRLYQDFALELKRNYYNVLLNRMNWDTFNKLLIQANKILALGELMYKKGLLTEMEYRQLHSTFEQIKFYFVSTQKELSLAELALRQTMNLPEDQELSLVNWLPFEKVNIDLEQALKTAVSRRPELLIRRLVTYFNNLNEQIAKARDRLRISLTGKYGKMAEDQATEPVIYRDTWYVGLKFTKPLGASTLNTSVTKQRIPVGDFRAGENTDTLTETMEFAILDRLDELADEKTAHVEFLKAINEELETEETVQAEVEKAYANYITSLFQIETSLKKLEFQAQRIKVAEGRMKVQEGSITDLLQAYLEYANEKVNYNRALIGYYIALSSLARSAGVEDYLVLATEKPVVTAWEQFSENPPTKVSYTPFKLPRFEKEKRQAIPTGIAGRIIGVNNQYGMAILNLGSKNGLTPDSKLVVYRNGQEYAWLVPVKIAETTSACYLGEKVEGRFKGLRIGDKVEIIK
jgi:outer membrane protein TolC